MFQIITNVSLSERVSLEILNTGINGGCESWAQISDRVPSDMPALFSSARFTARSSPVLAGVVGKPEVTTGIQRVLSEEAPVSAAVRLRLLQALANDDPSGINPQVADCVIRAALSFG